MTERSFLKGNIIFLLNVLLMLLIIQFPAVSLENSDFLKNRTTIENLNNMILSNSYTENFYASFEVTYGFRKRNVSSDNFFSCRQYAAASRNYMELLVTDSDGKSYWLPLSREICDRIERNYRKNGTIIFYVMFFYKKGSKQYNYEIMRCDFAGKEEERERTQYW